MDAILAMLATAGSAEKFAVGMAGVSPWVGIWVLHKYIIKENEVMRLAIKEALDEINTVRNNSADKSTVTALRADMSAGFTSLSNQVAELSNAVIAAVSKR